MRDLFSEMTKSCKAVLGFILQSIAVTRLLKATGPSDRGKMRLFNANTKCYCGTGGAIKHFPDIFPLSHMFLLLTALIEFSKTTCWARWTQYSCSLFLWKKKINCWLCKLIYIWEAFLVHQNPIKNMVINAVGKQCKLEI